MFARFFKLLHLSRGQRAVVVAYGAVMAVAAGVTLMLMSRVEGANAIPPEPTLFDNWVICAGAIAAGIAMYFSRGWMGTGGALGFARACVGAMTITLVAAIIAGTLVSPFYGTLAGPFMLISEFVANPVLAMAWFTVLFVSHFMIAVWRRERFLGEHGSTDSAVSQLSALSRANLYGK